MTTQNDPIERIAVDLEIYGIPQSPDMPPMTETYLHVRRKQDGGRAVLGLPVYKGDQGDKGAAGQIHKGDRTAAELDGLAMVLDETALNFTYRNADDNSQWVWNGDTFVIYADAYGAPGPVGPAPVIEGGSVTVGGVVQPAPAGVAVDGNAGGPYTVSVELPELPEGPPGPPGLSGPIYTSVDVDQTAAPEDGDVLVHDSATGKLVWVPFGGSAPAVEEYVIPASMFPIATKNAGDMRHLLCSVTIPERPWRYRFDVSGCVDAFVGIGHRVDVEIRAGDPLTGELIGFGRGLTGLGVWNPIEFHPHADDAINPGSTVGVMPAGASVTVYASAVRAAGSTLPWQVRSDRANLRLRLLGVV